MTVTGTLSTLDKQTSLPCAIAPTVTAECHSAYQMHTFWVEMLQVSSCFFNMDYLNEEKKLSREKVT